MPIFEIQDHDAPTFVIAKNFLEALDKWRSWVRSKNQENPLEEPINPNGINVIAKEFIP